MRLFISHSHDDRAWAMELFHNLRDEADHHAWIDKGILASTDWWNTILNEIEGCDCLIFVMTPMSLESVYCQAEWNYALNLGKPLLPIKLKKCDYPALLSQKRIQYIDLASDYKRFPHLLLQMERSFSKIKDVIANDEYRLQQIVRPDLPQPKIELPKNTENSNKQNDNSAGSEYLSNEIQFSLDEALSLINSPRPKDRRVAIARLGQIAQHRPVVINALCDEDRIVRQEALKTLSQYRDDKTYLELVAISQSKRETRFRDNLDVSRINSLLVLEHYPLQEQYVELLKELLIDPDADIRRLAALGAGSTGNSDFWNDLMTLLDDTSEGYAGRSNNGEANYQPVNLSAAMAMLKLNWKKAKKYLETHMDGKFIEQLNNEITLDSGYFHTL